MKYVVVGGAGFIGSNIVDKLVEQNHEVVIIDNLSTGKMENVNPKASVEYIDICNVNECSAMVEIMSGADALFLLAAKARVQPSIENPVEYEINNTIGTLNVLKCASDAGVRRVVYSASSSAYGNTEKLPSKETDPINPLSPYGAQKYYGEVMCKMFSEVYGLETVSLRYFNIYGERQNVGGAYAMVIGIFADQRLRGEIMTINGDGSQRRDFTYVGDVVNANIAATECTEGFGEIYNIGTGNQISVLDLTSMIGGQYVHIDERPGECRFTQADITKSNKVLKWNPKVQLED